jgi:3-isopropylmalate/(R)-2-methylmalate dehydratase small subunit
MDYGFKVVISSRFADIFRGNSGKQGLLTAVVDQDFVDQLWKEIENHPETEVTVDLESRTITAGSLEAKFEVDDYVRWRLMEGLDDVGLTLQHVSEIGSFEAKRPTFKPVTA